MFHDMFSRTKMNVELSQAEGEFPPLTGAEKRALRQAEQAEQAFRESKGYPPKNRTGRRILVLVALVALLAVLAVAFHLYRENDLKKVVIPEESHFVGAPSAEENQDLTMRLTYDDSATPVLVEGDIRQTIRWEFSVYPKEGAEVHDFYYTLLLDDWIVERSNLPTVTYMGLAKGDGMDFPAQAKGLEAGMGNSVSIRTVDDPLYESAMTTPVKLMISYDNQVLYYLVTPVRAAP